LGIIQWPYNNWRAHPWMLRELHWAAALAPDGMPEKAYLKEKLINNARLTEGALSIADGNYPPASYTDVHDASCTGWASPSWVTAYYTSDAQLGSAYSVNLWCLGRQNYNEGKSSPLSIATSYQRSTNMIGMDPTITSQTSAWFWQTYALIVWSSIADTDLVRDGSLNPYYHVARWLSGGYANRTLRSEAKPVQMQQIVAPEIDAATGLPFASWSRFGDAIKTTCPLDSDINASAITVDLACSWASNGVTGGWLVNSANWYPTVQIGSEKLYVSTFTVNSPTTGKTRLTVAIGCSEDSTAPADTQSDTGLLEGEIGSADFEITVNATRDENRRFEGPFVLRGSNLHYVDSLQALSVDLTITNRGQVSHHEPIGLTFVKLIPAGVTVQNPDNGINGEGAAITFAFANDDAQWTPGETSLPRNVLFGVEPGKAVGFVARLDIGEPIDGGVIAGRVWHDANQDGVMDPDEGGIPGIRVFLRSIEDDPDTTVSDTRLYRFTDPDGQFAFRHLRAGVYVVGPGANVLLFPTTPTEITVLLTESNGDVTDFTDANFGAIPHFEPPDPFPIGAYAIVKGAHIPDPDRVKARSFGLVRCPESDSNELGDDGINCRIGILRGSVTAVDEGKFAVMGTWVTRAPTTTNVGIDLEVGDRVDVGVHRSDGGDLIAVSLVRWTGDHEEVHGRIQRAEVGEDGVVRLRILDTLVIVMRNDDDVVTP
jgi:hypothetical protein